MLLLKISVIRKITFFLVAAMLSVSAMAADFNQVMQRFANQGDAFAQYHLGVLYYQGEGVSQDYAKAAEWFEKAANQDSADAQKFIAAMYYQGKGVGQDYAKAAAWYRKAANQDDAIAQNLIAGMYYLGEGVSRNIIIAKEWSRKACDNGEQKGCDSYKILDDRGY